MYVPSDWFLVVKEAHCRNPFEVALQQENFLIYKDFISGCYTNFLEICSICMFQVKVPMNRKLFLFSFRGYLKKCRFPKFENSRLKNDDFTSLQSRDILP